MHFLAMVTYETDPRKVESLFVSWKAIWAAADISFKQVQADLQTLDYQVNQMNAEFIRIKDTRENVGLDGLLEDAKGPVINPLYHRLDSFLTMAKPKIAQMKQFAKSLESSLERNMNRYGESLLAMSEEDPTKKFFSTFTEFAKSYHKANDDNFLKRKAQEEADLLLQQQQQKQQLQKQLQQQKSLKATVADASISANTTTTSKPVKKAENLFGQFHKSQTASANDLIAEFRMKQLAKKSEKETK
jgi:hypothetical protein